MRGWLAASWHGMGPWKWVGIAAIVIVIVLTPATASGLEPVGANFPPHIHDNT